MPTLFKRLLLQRFHSIPAESISLTNPAFFVGCNGSGKSNLVDAFAFLSECVENPLQAVFDRRGGVFSVVTRTPTRGASDELRWRDMRPTMGLGLEVVDLPTITGDDEMVSARYSFQVRAVGRYVFEVVRKQYIIRHQDGKTEWFERGEKDFRSNIEFLAGFPQSAPTSLAFPLLGSFPPFAFLKHVISNMRVYSIEASKLRSPQDPDVGSRLRSDGRNAASVLSEIRESSPHDFERIGELLGAVSDGVRRVWTVKQGRQLALKFGQEWDGNKRLTFDAFSMSDGTLRALGLILAVYQTPSPALLAIEEPEASIHPGAHGVLLDLLRDATRRMQVVMTTHSPEVLDAKWIGENNLRVVTLREGATRVGAISEFSRAALREQLMGAGELLRTNSLEQAPLFDADDPDTIPLFQEVD